MVAGNQGKERRDLRLEVADQLVERIENGTAPWQRPWEAGGVMAPVNAVTGKPYRGVNYQNLMMFSPDLSDPRWCTYKQAQEQGWQVCEGSRGLPIEVWKEYERKRTEEELENLRQEGADNPAPTERRLGVRYYTVFHASQIKGIPPLAREPRRQELEGHPDPRLDALADALGIEVRRGGDRAFYRPGQDFVQMPRVEDFHSATGHDTTLLHELSHATGHPGRLNRKFGRTFGDQDYAIEELRAEMSAAMTAAALGIGFDPDAQNREEGREQGNSAAYLALWLKALPEKERKQAIVGVIQDAQGISDYLIERTPERQVEQERASELAREAEKAPEVPVSAKLLTKVPDEVRPFLGVQQASVTDQLLQGEEKAFFSDKMWELQEIIRQMPETYETDGKPDSERPVSLRYFGPNGAQWFIIEKDRGDPENEGPGLPEQTQAFGLADLGIGYPEVGYINIPEITQAGAELDYHFTPRTLLEVKQEHYPDLLPPEHRPVELRNAAQMPPPHRDPAHAARALEHSLETLGQHDIILSSKDGGSRTFNARQYLEDGLRRGFTVIEDPDGTFRWQGADGSRGRAFTDEKLIATFRAAAAVDKDIGRAIRSVERQKADLEWER